MNDGQVGSIVSPSLGALVLMMLKWGLTFGLLVLQRAQ